MDKSVDESAITAPVAKISGRSRVDAFEAAKQVRSMDRSGLVKALVEILRDGRRPFNRSAAAYALQGVSSANAIGALERTACNKSENADVRGHALEALAHGHRKSTHDLLLKTMRNSSKHVRFWAAFTLGEMREKRAVTALRVLLVDNREIRGFHSVAEEAADAIALIERGESCLWCSLLR